jgi:hypothetical protein
MKRGKPRGGLLDGCGAADIRLFGGPFIFGNREEDNLYDNK